MLVGFERAGDGHALLFAAPDQFRTDCPSCSFQEQGKVLWPTLPGANAVENLQHPAGALPAWCALAARLVLGESEEVAGKVHHAGALVHDHQATGAHNRPGFLELLIVNG